MSQTRISRGPIPAPARVALINGGLYGYGPSLDAAKADFRSNISGASRDMQAVMLSRVQFVGIDDDHASDVAEMLAADVIEWER